MSYTSVDQVATVIDVDEADDIQPFVDTASQIVNRVCLSSGYTDSELELIERWLSAHFYDINRPRDQSQTAGEVKQTSEPVKVDLLLDNTKYGQQAIILDVFGNLAALNNRLKNLKGNKVGIGWLGVCHPKGSWLWP